MDIFLSNCTIADGTGAKPFSGGILVSGERIAKIADRPPEDFAGRVIDCRGLLVTPGFIDCHSHNDWFALSPEKNRYFDPFLQQGITTFVTGNCGFSVPGYDAGTAYKDQIGGGLFHLDENSAKTTKAAQWFEAVDRNCPANLALLAGHGTARIAVNGNKDMPLSPGNRAAMLRNLEEALESGACGVSLGLMYEPGLYAPTDELSDVARLCVKYGKILTVHARACSAISMSYSSVGRSHLLLALDEMARLVRETGVRLEYSHLIFVGRRSWKDVDEALSIFQKVKAEGFDAGFDLYPLDYGASIITVVLPGWYQAMTPAQRKRPFTRLKLAAMVKATTLLLGFGFSDILIAYAGEGQRDLIGSTVAKIAKKRKVSNLSAYLDICEKSDFKARVLMGSYQNELIVRQLMESGQSLFMTDAWVEESGKQNGAIYGAFPRFFKIARELGWPVEKMVERMTGSAARRFGMEQRGFIKEGCFADLNVIDPDNFKDRIEEELPPAGLRYVFVNGNIVLENGELIPGREAAGRAVRVGGRPQA